MFAPLLAIGISVFAPTVTSVTITSSLQTCCTDGGLRSYDFSAVLSRSKDMLSYTRSDGRTFSISAIEAITSALGHAQEVPSFASLRVPPSKGQELLRRIRSFCNRKPSESEALRSYFAIHVLHTDDYPDEVVTINMGTDSIRLESTAQQLFGLPWHISGMWPQFDDYDSNLSLAIAAISDPKADPNYDRLINSSEWQNEFESSFVGVSCGQRVIQ